MFAEKVCEQVVGFSVMAEDEMFEVNGGTAYDSNGNAIPGSGNNGTSSSGASGSNNNNSTTCPTCAHCNDMIMGTEANMGARDNNPTQQGADLVTGLVNLYHRYKKSECVKNNHQ